MWSVFQNPKDQIPWLESTLEYRGGGGRILDLRGRRINLNTCNNKVPLQKNRIRIKLKSDSNRWQQFWLAAVLACLLVAIGSAPAPRGQYREWMYWGLYRGKQHKFWAKVYFIVGSDLFPGLWQRHSLTFSFSQPIDASSITGRASLPANSWLRDSHPVDTSFAGEAAQVLHHVRRYGKTKRGPN